MSFLAAPTFLPDGRIILAGFIDNTGDPAQNHHTLLALSATGSQLWSHDLGPFPTSGGTRGVDYFGQESSPAVTSVGNIYIGSWDQNIYAYTNTGAKKWSINPQPTGRAGFIRTSPVVDKNGIIYVYYDRDLSVANSTPHMYALRDNGSTVSLVLNPTTHLPLDWSPSFGGANSRAIASPALGTDGRIYLATFFESGTEKHGNIFAVNTSDFTEAWAFPAMGEGCIGPVMANPVIGQDGTIYIGTQKGSMLGTTANPHLYALNPLASLTSAQRLRWQWPVDGQGAVIAAIDASPAIGSDGSLYIPVDSQDPPTSTDPQLAKVSSDGVLQWRNTSAFDQTLTTDNTPIIGADGTIYVKQINPFSTLGSVSKVFAFDPSTGSLLSSTEVPHDLEEFHNNGHVPYPSMALDSQGRIIAVTPALGIVHFLDTTKPGYSFWPKWGANLQNTGNVQHNAWNLKASVSFTLTILPRLPGGSGSQAAVCVNNTHQVAGWEQTSTYQQAGIWNPPNFTGAAIPLLGAGHTSYARWLNGSGLVVGIDYNGTVGTPFRWTQSGGTIALPQAFGFSNSDAVACNDDGLAAGSGVNSTSKYRALRWNDLASAPDDLGSIAGTDPGNASYAFAINKAGTVVGKSITASPGVYHGFKTVLGSFIAPSDDIGTLSGVPTDYSEAHAINASGRIAGASTISANHTNAFIKPPVIASSSAFQNIGNIGGNYAVITSINNRGQAVGWGINGSGFPEAFLIQPNGTMQSLDGMLFYNSVSHTQNPVITDDGTIVASGTYSSSQRGFILVPQ